MEPLVNASPTPAFGDHSTLSERVYTLLRDKIVTLELAPGSPIHEERLSHSLRAGRTPVREAIKRLQTEGLVVVYPRRGTFITEINITDHGLIVEVRRVLEGQAAASAAHRATETDRQQLARLAHQCRQPPTDTDGDAQTLLQLDTAVHRTLYRCTHNKYLAGTLDQYYNLTLRIWYLFLARLSGMTEHVHEHAALLDHVAAGEADAARAAAIAHVTHFEQAVLHALHTPH